MLAESFRDLKDLKRENTETSQNQCTKIAEKHKNLTNWTCQISWKTESDKEWVPDQRMKGAKCMHLRGDVKVKEIMGKCWYTNGGRGHAVRPKWIRITSCSGLAAMPVEKPQGVPHDSVWSKLETFWENEGEERGKNLGARANQELGFGTEKVNRKTGGVLWLAIALNS